MRLLPILCLLLLLAACAEPDPSSLRFGLSSAPATLDPRFATDAASTRINRLLYDRLVDFDERFQPVPALARWEKLGPTHYRFILEDGHVFHNGDSLTAHDVKATYDSVLEVARGSPHRGALRVIADIEVRDARTVEFHLSRPDALFPGRLVIGIMPRRLLAQDHPFNVRPVGSGPFDFVAWPSENRLRLRRLADGKPVEFLRVADPTVRVLKLLRGEIDMMQGDLPPELVAWLETRENVRVQRGRGTSFAYLGFNMNDSLTRQRAVRRAIAHAVDRDAIIHHVLGGAARPASALLPPHHWAGHPDLPRLEFDLEKARALLASAGYSASHRPHLVYKTSSDPFRIRLATIIQDQLGAAGIDVELRSYDWGTFYGDVKAGRFQMYSLAWIGIKMPDIFHYAFHSASVPPAGANRGRFASPVADRLITDADRSDDPQVQAAIYRKLQEHLLEALPYVPLWYEDNVFVARDDIRGYSLANDGNYDGLMAVERAKLVSGDVRAKLVAH
jgi:peptide/nickel transport system substrate-binding protein